MKGTRAAVRYAKALKQLAQENNILDAIHADVKLVLSTIEENKELKLMLESPLVKSEKKQEVLLAIFGSKVNELTINFMKLLITQNRENLLPSVCDKFIELYNEAKGIGIVSVTTSIPLTDSLRDELTQKIKSEYNYSEVHLEEHVDESIIGGMILRMGDKQLDASIRRQLNDIKQELIHA